jgi:predicted ester cyclase
MSKARETWGGYDGIVDFILGITHEIWEQRQIDRIARYYAGDTPVFSLEGLTDGSAAMIDGTRGMLEAFPDRLLLGDDVIWSGSPAAGYYSSHRIVSPMTNLGPSMFGPATGRAVRIMNIADCVVENGVITREWLLRDNLALVRQLGFDTIESARCVAGRRTEAGQRWIASEVDRVRSKGLPATQPTLIPPVRDAQAFAERVIQCLWSDAKPEVFDAAYAPYAVLHRSPVELFSGRRAIAEHFSAWRRSISVAGISVDHIAMLPYGADGLHLAARWTVAGQHRGELLGIPASGRDVYILGATHWRIVANRIAVEWTVFDSLSVLSQLIAA